MSNNDFNLMCLKCPYCGKPIALDFNENRSKVCRYCGASWESITMIWKFYFKLAFYGGIAFIIYCFITS